MKSEKTLVWKKAWKVNDKEFFKQALKDEMPDLEKIRQEILKTPVKENTKVKSFNSQMLFKRVLPAVACVAIIAISAFAALKTENTDDIELVQEPNTTFSQNETVNHKNKKKNKNKAVYTVTVKNNNKNKNKSTPKKDQEQKETETQETSFQKIEDKEKYLSAKKQESCSISLASKIKVDDNGIVYCDDEANPFRLSFKQHELSMILENNIYYSNSKCSDGTIKRVNGVVCCEFECEGYKVGYTLSKTSINNSNYTTKDLNDYCCYINSNSETAKELLESLDFSPVNL